MVKTNDALEILGKVSQDDPDLQEMVQVASVNAEVAQLIYAARTQAGLTQQELADLISTQQPVIARLEDADYEGHSLSMLQRIAQALNRRVEIALVPLESDSTVLAQALPQRSSQP
ncbi:helix-turn-helix domain-containing protein [Acaryochloris marina NIES-2412]|uniref:helix-turn-helix domain-containing protein n=1 Tax=Acaryochloris marina TaxID=155978 RepID=UPI004059D20C